MEHVCNSIPLVYGLAIELSSTHSRNVINVVDSIFRSAFPERECLEMIEGKECAEPVYINFIV